VLDPYIDRLLLVWLESLVGGVLIVASAIVGWRLAAARGGALVRVVGWWLDHVVRHVIVSRSWLRRTVLIAANNSFSCGVLVLLGGLGHVAWLAVCGLGLALGVAVRWIIETMGAYESEHAHHALPRRAQVLQAIGFAVNMLEIPAILLSAGLSLGQGAMSSALEPFAAVTVFAVIVVPLLIVGAAGEALWMTCDPDLPNIWPPQQRPPDDTPH